jgi:hypothetical protein
VGKKKGGKEERAPHREGLSFHSYPYRGRRLYSSFFFFFFKKKGKRVMKYLFSNTRGLLSFLPES